MIGKSTPAFSDTETFVGRLMAFADQLGHENKLRSTAIQLATAFNTMGGETTHNGDINVVPLTMRSAEYGALKALLGRDDAESLSLAARLKGDDTLAYQINYFTTRLRNDIIKIEEAGGGKKR